MRLRAKFGLSFAPLALLAAGLILALSKRAVDRIIMDQAVQRGRLLLADLEGPASDGLASGKESRLLPLLQSAAQRSGALYAAALAPDGRVLAHTNVAEVGKHYPSPGGETGWRRAVYAGRPVLEISMPVWEPPAGVGFLLSGAAPKDRRLGALQLGLGIGEALKVEDDIGRQMLLVVLLIGGAALAAAWLLIARLLRPIRDLAEATEQIRQGRLTGARVPVLSNDELGELARSFNEMSRSLSETTVSREFFSSITASMLDALIVARPDGTLRMVNAAASRLLGYEASELLERPMADLWGAEEKMRRSLGDLLAGGAPRSVETEWVSKDGRPRPVLFSASLLRDRKGRPEAVIGVAKDIAELKQAELRMRQSEKLSALGQLVGGVAHEVNNPLGVILGFAQSLAKRLKPDDPATMPIRSIEREAIRCKKLVQDLLVFSRQARTRDEPFDVDDAVDNALSLVQYQARLQDVRLERRLGGAGRLHGDRNQIQQVVINLCNNAIDAMPGGGRLTVSTARDGDSVILEAADTGSGIPETVKPRIFEPFFTTKEAGKGTGLGLALVHEIVVKHGGQITVESRPGKTVFRLRFPAPATS